MVCLNNLARKYLCFGVVVLIMAAIFYFLNSNVASIFAEEENYPKTYQQTAILVLEMSDNQIFLKKAAKLNKEFIQIQAKETEAFVGDIEFKVISEASSLIYAGVAPDPSLVHYDWLDQEGNLFGGAIKKDSAVFTVKIPYQTDVQSVNFIKKIGEGHFLSDQNLGSIDLSQLQYSNELVSDGFSGTGFSQAPSVLGSSLPAPGNLQVVDRGAVYIKWLWDEVPEADHYLFCSYKSNDCSGEDFCRAISNIYHRKEVLLPQPIILFKYMPANVEIVEPELVVLSNNGWSDIFSEVTRRLHGYDEIARVLQIQNAKMQEKLKELGVNVVDKPEEEKVSDK